VSAAAPQSGLTVRELETYVEHCKKIVRDINFVLADEKLKSDGWTIVYAVDFSEIRSYVLPQAPNEPAPFRDGWAGWATEEVALTQFNILQSFFTKQRPVLLPEPYAVELRSFYDSLPTRVLSNVAKALLHAIDEVTKTLASEEGRKVIEIANTSEERLTGEQIDFILNFFEKEAASLVVFARGGELEPVERMNQLLQSKPFLDLADYASFGPAQLDDGIVARRYDALRIARGKGRSPAVSFSDAVAIEHIRLANHALEKNKTRILLLGRSKHMPNVLDTEGDLWAPHGPIVRHPRVFSNAYHFASGSDPRLPTLERRRASLQLLIASGSTRAKEMTEQGDVAATRPLSRDPKVLIKKIQEEWNVTNSLATALEDDTASPRTKPAATAATLLKFLRNREELFTTAQSRVADMLAATTRKQEILAFQLQTDPAETGRGDVKYRFEFKDPSISAVIDRLVGKSFVSLAETTELFTAGLKTTSNYERLLAMAVSLGALGRWQLAEQAAGRAILEANAEGVSSHEGHFVMAVAIRKQRLTPERIVKALADLNTATVERKEAGLPTPDPRYLKEMATIELIWSRKTVDDGATFNPEFAPMAEHIVELLDQAMTLTSDLKLKVEILNNFCYLFATPPTIDKARARRYLQELEKTLTEWTPDRRLWPSSIRDTVIFTNFQLASPATPLSDYEAWAKELDSIPVTDFNSDDRYWVKTHRKAIHDVILEQRGQATAKPPT
jgi:hypothetical protein